MQISHSTTQPQTDLFALRDRTQVDTAGEEAEALGLVYVRLDGNIGGVVDGASLALASNEAISLYGGKTANFPDAGG